MKHLFLKGTAADHCMSNELIKQVGHSPKQKLILPHSIISWLPLNYTLAYKNISFANNLSQISTGLNVS